MTPDTKTVRLLGAERGCEIPASNVYFTFGSGRFAYDCVTCGSRCCRGFGFVAATKAELHTITSRRALPLFLMPGDRDHRGQHQVANCAPGCFFLADDGRCDIHAQDGYGAKPETCRLFPFNNIRRLDDYLIVAPHAGLCPLSVTDEPSSCSDHMMLLEGLSAQGLAAAPRPCTATQSAADAIAMERAILELAESGTRGGDYLTFVRAQTEMTRGSTITHAGPDLSFFVQAFERLTGLPMASSGDDGDIGRRMIAITPFLRSRLVFHDRRSPTAAAVPSLPLERVPLAILSVYLLAMAARIAGMRQVTFQTIAKLEMDFRAFSHLFAHSDAVMVWRSDAPIDVTGFDTSDERMAFVRLAKALLPAAQRKRRAPLSDLLEEHAPHDSLSRVYYLKRAAQHLAGCLGPLDAELRSRNLPITTRMRDGVHRWVLANADEPVLRSMYDRLHPLDLRRPEVR